MVLFVQIYAHVSLVISAYKDNHFPLKPNVINSKKHELQTFLHFKKANHYTKNDLKIYKSLIDDQGEAFLKQNGLSHIGIHTILPPTSLLR